MNKVLEVGDCTMVRITETGSSIKVGYIVPVIHTRHSGLMLHTLGMGVHILPQHCQRIDMPLQCLINQ